MTCWRCLQAFAPTQSAQRLLPCSRRHPQPPAVALRWSPPFRGRLAGGTFRLAFSNFSPTCLASGGRCCFTALSSLSTAQTSPCGMAIFTLDCYLSACFFNPCSTHSTIFCIGGGHENKSKMTSEGEEAAAKTLKQQGAADTEQEAPSSSGQVLNLMSSDCDRVANFCPSFHQVWSLPFQIGVALFLLYQQVGLSFLAGLMFAILLIPINRLIAKRIGTLSTAMMKHKDARVKTMNEVLHGIKVVKLYAWEAELQEKISAIRHLELKALAGRKYLDALCVFFWASTPVLISILTFTTYVWIQKEKLTAATVFTSLALFNILIGPLNAFPWVLNGLVEAWVSIRRVEGFLWTPDVASASHGQPASPAGAAPDASGTSGDEPVIILQDASFSWNPPDGDRILNNVTMAVPSRGLVCLYGPTGGGKSSVLAALLGELDPITGTVTRSAAVLSKGIGYAAQEPWLQNTSIRDNILCGEAYDDARYTRIVYACALVDDLRAIPGGDRAKVGEGGASLSGGQKARVALARAVYAKRPLYVLDDPIAALDSRVAQHVLQHAIVDLLAKEAVVVLCTHSQRALEQADKMYRVLRGRVRETSVTSATDIEQFAAEDEDDDDIICGDESGGTVAEERKIGVVDLAVYGSYWNAVGTALAVGVLLALFLMQASRNVSDWWLSFWVTHSRNPDHASVGYYLSIYAYLSAANAFCTLLRAFSFAYAGVVAAKAIHSKLLLSLLNAPLQFFAENPTGRIVNRLSSDIYAIDDSLPFIANILFAQFAGLVGTIAVTCYGLPYFAAVLPPIGCVYYIIQYSGHACQPGPAQQLGVRS
eukprot:m.390480 g.390480  ORF g.390480 m.390480 type:complete len:821 (+) comp20078_c0_seq3:722-3184(+)